MIVPSAVDTYRIRTEVLRYSRKAACLEAVPMPGSREMASSASPSRGVLGGDHRLDLLLSDVVQDDPRLAGPVVLGHRVRQRSGFRRAARASRG